MKFVQRSDLKKPLVTAENFIGLFDCFVRPLFAAKKLTEE